MNFDIFSSGFFLRAPNAFSCSNRSNTEFNTFDHECPNISVQIYANDFQLTFNIHIPTESFVSHTMPFCGLRSFLVLLQFFYFVTQQVQLSQEAIHILSLSPGSRTEDQLQTVSKITVHTDHTLVHSTLTFSKKKIASFGFVTVLTFVLCW